MCTAPNPVVHSCVLIILRRLKRLNVNSVIKFWAVNPFCVERRATKTLPHQANCMPTMESNKEISGFVDLRLICCLFWHSSWLLAINVGDLCGIIPRNVPLLAFARATRNWLQVFLFVRRCFRIAFGCLRWLAHIWKHYLGILLDSSLTQCS